MRVNGFKSGERFGFDFAQRAEDATFTYTIDGRLAYSSRNASSTTYQYDPSSGALSAYRPSGAATVTLSYDASGHVTAAGTRRYSSDLLGRRVNAGTAANTRETTLTWTGERLVGLSKASSVAATHAYDPSGQRIRSVVREGSLVTTTTWHYDGIALSGLDATRSDGTTFSLDYVRDEKGDLVIGIYADTTTAPKPFLMVTTDRGDVRELLDYGRNAFAFYGYDEYGNPTEIASAATGTITTALAAKIVSRQPLRYASYCWDAHSALYYCSARYYDPATASFASKDPADADGEESAYQYCGGEPVGKVDPSGRWGLYVHITMTKKWMRDSRAAGVWSCYGNGVFGDIIAEKNNRTDSDSDTGGDGHREYHYEWQGARAKATDCINTAVYFYKRGDNNIRNRKSRAWKWLGRGLHASQDRLCHRRQWIGFPAFTWLDTHWYARGSNPDPMHAKYLPYRCHCELRGTRVIRGATDCWYHADYGDGSNVRRAVASETKKRLREFVDKVRGR